MTTKISVTDRHISIMREALELYCFLNLGKMSALWSVYLSRDIDPQEFDEKVAQLKRLIFPELEDNSWYGVGWNDSTRQQRAQIAYEIEAMLRGNDKPLHYSTENLIEVEKIDE